MAYSENTNQTADGFFNMSDIVDMLRTPTGCVPPSGWELKAAKEIERLRRELFKIQCEQLDRATNTARSAKTLRKLAMGTRNRIITTLNGSTARSDYCSDGAQVWQT